MGMQGSRCIVVLLLLSVLVLISTSAALAHNITELLSSRPDFATFNRYLSRTRLSYEVNSRNTITVLAIDNSAMTTLLAPRPTLATLRNRLSLHILLDYFDAGKLHQLSSGTAVAATIFQTTGKAPGMSGFVNMTDLGGGKVGFKPQDGSVDFAVFFVKSLVENPYNISVVQISGVIPSAEAAAPVPDPSMVNFMDTMTRKGCAIFAATLVATPKAFAAYKDNLQGGLTLFCPGDEVFLHFLAKFKNLTVDNRISYLEFCVTPIYRSLATLQSTSGPINTLATSGPGSFVFTVQNVGPDIALKTKVNTVKIIGTGLDQQPIAIYLLEEVLLPHELSASAPVPAPSPAPAPASTHSPPVPTPESPSPPAPPPLESVPPTAPPPLDGPVDQTPPPKSHGARAHHQCLVMSLISLALIMMS
ncbi:hypothetical protein MLD38_000904 [Melastoma candidum]|uniref:Uncharacterized protein n=1 Tax=Melastoma candidum TaxID=119954 RepID=A0ACB9SB21_9MYRT|nr:hypothetical protein MLD38_000904 [Melastoma candidum]